jgi:IS605 OrfB family transposase
MAQYTACFNHVAGLGWEQRLTNGVELHRRTYYQLRGQYPHMPSQLVISARAKAREALKSALVRRRQGHKAHCPRASRGTVRYDARSYTFWPQRSAVSLATTQGRLRLAVTVPAYFQRYLEVMVGLDSADLVRYPDGQFWLHVVVTMPDPAVGEDPTVSGVDVGISRVAVASNGRFFSGKRVKEHARKLFRQRRALQAKGTKSAKRHLKRLGRRENRFRRDVNHQVSKHLVESLPPGSTLALEDLTDIRERVKARRKARRELHNWPFAQFRQFVAYKAAARGIRVVYVDARYSSQGCSRCGHVARSNRQSQSWFACRRCGYQLNADLNAARNLARRATGAPGGLLVNQPIVSDTAIAVAPGTSHLL